MLEGEGSTIQGNVCYDRSAQATKKANWQSYLIFSIQRVFRKMLLISFMNVSQPRIGLGCSKAFCVSNTHCSQVQGPILIPPEWDFPYNVRAYIQKVPGKFIVLRVSLLEETLAGKKSFFFLFLHT